MASHGRRKASKRTKYLKKIKALQRENNRRLRKMGKYAKYSNAVKHQLKNGMTAFTRNHKRGHKYTMGELNKYYFSSKEFQKRKTSTLKGTINTMASVLSNVIEVDGQKANYIVRTLSDHVDGTTIVVQFFDMYSDVVDMLEAQGLYGIVRSGDVVDMINSVIDSHLLDFNLLDNPVDMINSRSAVLSGDGMLTEIVDKLKTKYAGTKLYRK